MLRRSGVRRRRPTRSTAARYPRPAELPRDRGDVEARQAARVDQLEVREPGGHVDGDAVVADAPLDLQTERSELARGCGIGRHPAAWIARRGGRPPRRTWRQGRSWPPPARARTVAATTLSRPAARWDRRPAARGRGRSPRRRARRGAALCRGAASSSSETSTCARSPLRPSVRTAGCSSSSSVSATSPAARAATRSCWRAHASRYAIRPSHSARNSTRRTIAGGAARAVSSASSAVQRFACTAARQPPGSRVTAGSRRACDYGTS